MELRAWFRLACHPATVRRAFLTAMIVGCVLIAINHGPAILAGQMTPGRTFQALLTVLVPYTVSTISSVATRRELAPRSAPKAHPRFQQSGPLPQPPKVANPYASRFGEPVAVDR